MTHIDFTSDYFYEVDGELGVQSDTQPADLLSDDLDFEETVEEDNLTDALKKTTSEELEFVDKVKPPKITKRAQKLMDGYTPQNEDPLSRYIRQVNKTDLLTAKEEMELATRWVETRDKEAADKLIVSHMRLVIKIAYGYRNYGLIMEDMIAEGTMGLFKALRNFKPEMGNRFSTYAMWWIKAEVKDFVLHNWSLVKMGTTRAQKILFFSLRKLRRSIQRENERRAPLTDAEMQKIAEALGVSKKAVQNMEMRLGDRDHSLNASWSDSDGDDLEWQDALASNDESQEDAIIKEDEFLKRRAMLQKALEELKPREAQILTERKLAEKPKTLEELASTYNLSRERIRQIENAAFKKVQKAILSRSL